VGIFSCDAFISGQRPIFYVLFKGVLCVCVCVWRGGVAFGAYCSMPSHRIRLWSGSLAFRRLQCTESLDLLCLRLKRGVRKCLEGGGRWLFGDSIPTFAGINFCFIWPLFPLRRLYEAVSKSFRTGRLERELQTVQLSATRCSCIAILWVILVSFAAITLCVASQRVFVFVYFVIDSVRKLLNTSSYSVEW
jgi:hypothetical protein